MRVCVLVALAACSYKTPPNEVAPDSTAELDAPEPDTAPANTCFGQFGTVCVEALPSSAFSIGNTTATVITDVASNCEETTSETTVIGCVKSGTSMTIDGKLIGNGGRSLILIATSGPLIVERLVDVSSHHTDPIVRGAGANPNGLCAGAGTAVVDAGGAGGSMVGTGGDGGAGFVGNTTSAAAGAIPTMLRGGCPGNLGGGNSSATAGGLGGGAVWLISNERITITSTGVINASGSGGKGGSAFAGDGGAGGGAGGMVVLDAPIIEIDGTIVAAGGGGGGGSDGTFSGDDGSDPDPSDPGNPANGGFGAAVFGGDGGTTGDGEDGGSNGAATGCGGGGGTGLIRAIGTVTTTGIAIPTIMN